MKRSTLGAIVASAVFASGWNFGTYLHSRQHPAGPDLSGQAQGKFSVAAAKTIRHECPSVVTTKSTAEH